MIRSGTNIEDVFLLSPVQSGMLYHCLLAPDANLYFEQCTGPIEGFLKSEVFLAAWQRVLDRHAALRASFVWEGVKDPVQVIHAALKFPCEQIDWRGVGVAEQQERLAVFLAADRQRGFLLEKAPLLRLAVIRLGDERHQLVLSVHHLLLDGWSFAAVLQEVFADYRALCEGREVAVPARRPYRDYIAWLQRQDLAAAAVYWRAMLAGFSSPTPLGVDQPLAEPERLGAMVHGERQHELSVDRSAALQEFCRRHQLTLNTLVQGAWALVLSCYSGQDDVVFGAVVSGRPAELRGADAMIGLFINTLPVRVRLHGEDRLLDWLKELQVRQAEARQYECSPLVEIQGWSEVPRGQPLFESLLAFENYPVDQELWQPSDLSVGEVDIVETINYPLVVTALPRERLSFRVAFDLWPSQRRHD